jgi:hypothetical protein
MSSPNLFESLESRRLFALAIQIDYSLDTAGFFASADRRAVLEQAASMIGSRLDDALAAITPGGGNSWSLVFNHPSTGQQHTIVNPSIPANTIRLYVGARDLGASLATGGPVGYNAAGTQSWLNTVAARGQAGALGPESSRTDFAPAAGVITFDIDANWHFGPTTSGLSSSESDFLSTALHELGHVLGFGTAASFRNLVAGGVFTGSRAVAVHGQPVAMSGDGSHFAEGVQSNHQEVAFDPTLLNGSRKLLTDLDLAALDDIGWEIAPAQPTVGAVTNLTLINAATDQPVGTLVNGQTINLANFPIAIRAETSGAVGSVAFVDNGSLVRYENVAPYAIAGDGDDGRDYYIWNVTPGTHTLTVTPFGGANGSGPAGEAKTITFTIVNNTTPPPPSHAVTSLTLINAATDQPVGTLLDGQTINIADFPIAIRAEVAGQVGSVVFNDNGVNIKTESLAPYSIAGDGNDGRDYYVWNVAPARTRLPSRPSAAQTARGRPGR